MVTISFGQGMLILGIIVAAILGYHWVRKLIEAARRREEATKRLIAVTEVASERLTALITATGSPARAMADLTTGLAKFLPAAEELRSNMEGIPKLLEGITKIAQAQLAVVQQQQQRMANPFGRTNGPLPQRDVAAANMEDEIQHMMRAEGVSREEAMLRMNPANQTSVWDGLTSGWGQ